nr:28S ribosomal protein S16, mitochondrial isoform X2 [Geotrypetes seraphini]
MVHITPLLLKRYYGGHVAIRMARSGCTNRPFFRIVAAFNKRARDGKYLEQLGSFDPMPNIYNEKLVSLNFERLQYWIGNGALPSEPVAKLLGLCGFYPLHPMSITKAERVKKKRDLESLRSSQEAKTEGQEQEQQTVQ